MRIGMIGLKGVPYPAGIENFTEQIGWRLSERGHEVTVYVRPYVQVGDRFRGMRIRHLPSINTKHLDALTHSALASLAVLFEDVDIVHYHALGPSVFSAIPRLARKKTIAHVHGLDWQRAKWSPFASGCLRAAESAAIYFPNRTIAISETLQTHLQQKYQREVAYVPTGVERYEYREPREIARLGLAREDYILFLSRLVPEKGCHDLIEAFKGLDTTKRLVIAGSGTHTSDYEASLHRAAGAEAGGRILFTGTVTGRLLEELFSNAYAYVLPSEVEGLPHTVLQALSFGRCALTSDIEPNVEALGGCGLTFKSGDTADLRRQLRFVLDHPEFVAACAEPARTRARDTYSWDAVVSRLESIYADCLGRPHTAAVPASTS
jgi:glycosyltransferase involved in cell wall biosynthesis